MTHRAARPGLALALAAATVLCAGCGGTEPPADADADEPRQSLPSTAPEDLMPVAPQPPSTVQRTNPPTSGSAGPARDAPSPGSTRW